MNWKAFEKTEAYMLSCMNDSAHDKEHIYRVLYTALDIAAYEQDVDYEILITACLLHDIGRGEQFENPALCHAAVGGDKAFAFLMDCGWTQERAGLVTEVLMMVPETGRIAFSGSISVSWKTCMIVFLQSGEQSWL